jgi:hypothetical protein
MFNKLFGENEQSFFKNSEQKTKPQAPAQKP